LLFVHTRHGQAPLFGAHTVPVSFRELARIIEWLVYIDQEITMSDNKFFIKSRAQLGLGCGVVGFFLSFGVVIALQILLSVGLGGAGISQDIIGWGTDTLIYGSLWGIPAGLIGAIVFGLLGVAVGPKVLSKQSWRAMLIAIVAGAVPALILNAIGWVTNYGALAETQTPLKFVLVSVLWLGSLALLIAEGAIYGWQAQRSGRPPEIIAMALGGAITALVIGLFLDVGNPGLWCLFPLTAILGGAGGAIYALIARNRQSGPE
jgi:hypothetical protein